MAGGRNGERAEEPAGGRDMERPGERPAERAGERAVKRAEPPLARRA
jgi:hypothetical protein